MANRLVVKVALPIALDKEFDYLLTGDRKPKCGSRLLVDFRGRKMVAVLTDFAQSSNIANPKPVLCVLDNEPPVTAEQIKFASQLSEHYPYSRNEFIFMMLPKYLQQPRKSNIVSAIKAFQDSEGQRIFIKAQTFKERYGAWKEIVKKKLEEGSVIIILPQVSYLKEAKKILEKDFSDIKIMHSYENDKALFLSFNSSRNHSLILGTRFCLFYYPADLRLIVMEEENSPYFFQEEKPFYRMLDVVFLLSKLKKIDVVFGSSLPSLYAYNLVKTKKLGFRELVSVQPQIKIVNLVQDVSMPLNPVLIERLRQNIENNKKAVIIWNKTGFGSSLACSNCGHIFQCENCSGFLKLSIVKNKSICPYCGREHNLAKVCSFCKSGYIRSCGLGMERIALMLKRIFPEAIINCWDSRTKDSQIVLASAKILSALYGEERFDNGFFLEADDELSRLDYEAELNTYAYINKLASLFSECLYVFTRNSQQYFFKALNTDWQDFYKNELRIRKELRLPPFITLAKITLRALSEDKVYKQANEFYNLIKSKDFETYGPFKEQPFKLRKKFRYSIVIKSEDGYYLRKTIKELVQKIRTSSLKIAVIIM